MNTPCFPLPLEGGGWEGVSRNVVTEDVFHACSSWCLNSVRTIDYTPQPLSSGVALSPVGVHCCTLKPEPS